MDYSDKIVKNVFIINGKDNKKTKDFLMYLLSLPNFIQDNNLCKITSKKNDATILTKIYSDIYPNSIVYSCGGDGTLNEVVNGINSNSSLALIPLGTGNDFYRVYKDIGDTRKIDIGIINDRKFINIASIGIDAEIARLANDYKNNNIYKNYEYIMGITNSVIKNPHYLTDKGNLTLLAVCNGKYYGNGVGINPNYDLNDGKLEMYQANDLSRLKFIKLFLQIFNSTHYKNKMVIYDKIDNLSINANEPLICNVDGEIIYLKSINFRCLKDNITLTNNVPNYIKEYVLKIHK